MDPTSLIPAPDTIPAPAWLFQVLNIFTFMIHILFVNVVIGGSLIMLFSRLTRKDETLDQSMNGTIAGKIPTTFALAINFGVAPLLFVQVLYGHFIYSSSIFMAVFWISIIPLLIIAYYAAYIHVKKYSASKTLSMASLLAMSAIVLYIAFVFTNNMTLMVQPEKWSAYFTNRSGTILNVSDATFLPRYLHFIVASVAVAGMLMSIVWYIRDRRGTKGMEDKINSGLKIFAIATCVQVVIGFWFLLAIPSDFILAFMGRNLFYTIVLFAGILLAIGAIISAFLGKLIPSVIHLVAVVAAMVITRANLRSLYLSDVFSLNDLQLSPQYGVMALFFIVFAIGLVSVWIMLKIANQVAERRTV
ncbi:MAG: hypothetical protein V2J62_01085 [candidate division KSB1 bacterium]|jgi:hypothetical protein|nr:hypothetical protein [candidate division KSB1 bacterium]